MDFKPSNTLRQRLVHPKDKIPRDKQSNVVYAVLCNEECSDLYIGETKQHQTTSGQAVHLHLKEKGHWFERGVNEAIHVSRDRPPLMLCPESATFKND